MIACCDTWLTQQYAMCAMADSCAGNQLPVAVTEDNTCSVDSVDCLGWTLNQCCEWDCTSLPSCFTGANWSCCRGYCGELFGPDPNGSPVPVEIGGNPACANGWATFSGCCSPGAIHRTPIDPKEAPEWIVSFGAHPPSPEAGPEAAPDEMIPPDIPPTDPAMPSPQDVCVPTTCAAEHKTCDLIPDGCGGTIACNSDCSAQARGTLSCSLSAGSKGKGVGWGWLAALILGWSGVARHKVRPRGAPKRVQ